MLHTFVNGHCTTCGESLGYLLDSRYGETLGPKQETFSGQLEFQLTVSVYDYGGVLA